MANVDRPLGFRPLRHKDGGVMRASSYKIASGYAANIFSGDAVILASGYLNIAADDSALILGIFQGVRFQDPQGEIKFLPYWPASQVTLATRDAVAYVFDDPMISYRVQTDTGTAYVDATHKGGSYDLEKDHTGSTITGQSGMEIDLADTGTGQFLVLGLIDEPGNAAGVNADVEVLIRKSVLKSN